jgi:hypothetical protein
MNQTRVDQTGVSSVTENSLSRGILQRKCACGQQTSGGGECNKCRKNKSVLQRKKTSHSEASTSTLTAASVQGNGQSLPASLMPGFKPSLGSLLDRVRIHSDSSSANFADRQDAAAVTSGADIYFAHDVFQPGTMAGRNLIAHELAHVHQQHRTNGPPAGYRSTPGDSYEREADRFAETGRLTTGAFDASRKASSVFQQRTAAEQIATALRNAVEGLGTDEEAIFNALTGRTPTEIADIKTAYAALANGETLESRLRDELSGDDLSNALSLIQGETASTETARRLWDAMRGLGTDEEAIYATVAGRTTDQWNAIQQQYRAMAGTALLADLRDELNDSEWQYLQTLLPGVTGGAATDEDRATVIANQLEAAMAGLGTDEDAIYTALTGRSTAELRAIEIRFRLLTGFALNVRLRDELTDAEYTQAQRLLYPLADADRIAILLRDAVQGSGTDELEIQAILTGRTPAELTLINTAYQTRYGESLRDRLNEELSGAEQSSAETLRQHGTLPPEDEIRLAIEGAGTDEERITAIMNSVTGNPVAIRAMEQAYRRKYGDLIADLRSELSSSEYAAVIGVLGPVLQDAAFQDCSSADITGLRTSMPMVDRRITRALAVLNAGWVSMSGPHKSTFNQYFDPAGSGAVNQSFIDDVLGNFQLIRQEYNGGVTFECEAASGLCNVTGRYGYTYFGDIHICPHFFTMSPNDQSWGILHELTHNALMAVDRHYGHESDFNTLSPRGNIGNQVPVIGQLVRLIARDDTLNNPDSYALFAFRVI